MLAFFSFSLAIQMKWKKKNYLPWERSYESMDNVVFPGIYSAAKHTITQPQYKKKKSVETCDSSSWLMDRVEEGNQFYISEKKSERGLKSRAFIYIRSHA